MSNRENQKELGIKGRVIEGALKISRHLVSNFILFLDLVYYKLQEGLLDIKHSYSNLFECRFREVDYFKTWSNDFSSVLTFVNLL